MNVDLLLKNGVIESMDDKGNTYDSIAIKNNKIIAVGGEDNLSRYIQNNTKVVDLEGKVVVPGFIDAHQHIFKTGLELNQVDSRVGSIEELVAKCKEVAQEMDDEKSWIIGRGYDESLFKEKRHPLAKDFKGIKNPIFIEHYSGHSSVVNEQALKIANISKDTKVDYGSIEINEEENVPNGRLIEGASDVIKECMPPFTDQELKNALIAANQKYLQYGLTSVHEAGMGLTVGLVKEFKLLQEVKKSQEMKVKVYAMVMDEFFEDVEKVGLTTGFGDDHLKLGSVKIFVDGTLSLKTAAVSVSYKNNGGYGEKVHRYEDLEAFIYKAHKQGYQIACHAIGDEAVKDVLDAYENALTLFPNKDIRHRIEHVSVSNSDLIERMARLNVVAVPQPVFIYYAGDTYLENLNDELTDKIITIKSLMDKGLKPAGSSDSPVQDPSPFIGMYAAMTRKTNKGTTIVEDEKINLKEALHLYTSYAAYAASEENIKGSIEIGKIADLTVLPEDFLNYSAEQVKETEVEMTIIDGKIVYSKI